MGLISLGGSQSKQAQYLEQARDDHLAAVAADVHIYAEPLPSLHSGLKHKGSDGRLLGIRKGPAQDDARWARLG